MPESTAQPLENFQGSQVIATAEGSSVESQEREGGVESGAGLQLRGKRRRDRLVGCKVTEDEFNLIRQTAGERGMTVSDTIRHALNTAIFG